MSSPIGAIPLNQCVPRSAIPRFNEGASSTANKITAFVLSALASIVSFLFLPAEGAILISAGALALLSAYCCSHNNRTADAAEVRRNPALPPPVYVFAVAPPPVYPPPHMHPAIAPDYAPYPGGFVLAAPPPPAHHIQGPAAVVHGVPVRQDGPRVPVGYAPQAVFAAAPPPAHHIQGPAAVVHGVPVRQDGPRVPVGQAPQAVFAAAPPLQPAGRPPARVPVGHGHQ